MGKRATGVWYFIVLILAQHLAIAGEGTVLRGWVKDAYNKNALANAHVIISEIQAGTTTNNRGMFMFSRLDPGTYTLTIKYLGYLDHHEVISLDTGYHELTFLLRPMVIEIDPVTITATLNERRASLTPGRVALIPPGVVEHLPANNTDGLLTGIANVNVYRPWGIFSKSASVSMRGLPGSSRTLILIDGVPMNKAAGGAVNWNIIEPAEVKGIEVVKGPGSAIYGNNAMGGVISISTKKPSNPIEGDIRTFGGSLGTFGGSFRLGGIDLYKGKGVYWKLNGFARRGDGYINEPEGTRDSLDAKVDLNEYNAGILLGYRFDTATSLDASYRYYDGTFGTGIKVFEPDGSYDHYQDHLSTLSFNAQAGRYKINTRTYYKLENFGQLNENIGGTGKYKLTDTKTVNNDLGLWVNISREIFRNNLFTLGIEAKLGQMDARQIYRTSTDDLTYGGKLAFVGAFLQDEIVLCRKLSAVAGLRIDYASFYDGFLHVENPTSNTGFIDDVSEQFAIQHWNQFSPKLSLLYQVNQALGLFASAATGFMPPKIDDLARSGKISKGFKLANPELKPESLTNYELGLTWMPGTKFSLEPSVYYSRGHDFQYFVATGDSVETGGSDLKPVLQRRNITEVEILGAEITATWKLLTNLLITANYSMNDSRVVNFDDPHGGDKDLTGKGLIEVPAMMANASLSWQNRILNVFAEWHYTGKEWYDDENTQYIAPHHVVNMKVSKHLPQKIGFALSVQNIFNDMTIDRKGKLPPGRFFIGELSFEF